jgi:hypothetical protein
MSEESRYWFRAKRYGWGWGMPSTWQGWIVLLAFITLLLVGAHWLLPALGEVIYVGYALLLSALLLVICFVKGEPPRWRWGKD